MDRIFRILIVDDDTDWTDYCRGKLRRESLVIETTYTVQEALKIIGEKLYDVIFCDIKMEYTDEQGLVKDDGGFMVCERAKECVPQAKVIMVTAYDSRDYLVKSLRDGRSFDYLAKSSDIKGDITIMEGMILKCVEEWEKRVAPNPFHAQSGTEPEYSIANRELNISRHSKGEMDLLMECFERARQGSFARFLVWGPWGSGKSVLLRSYRRHLQKSGYPSSYYQIPSELGGRSTIEAGVAILQGIVDGFPMQPRHFDKFLNSVRKLGIKINLFMIEGNVEWEKENIVVSLDKLLADGFRSMLDDLLRKGDVAIILLDDLHNLRPAASLLDCLLRIMSGPVFQDKPIMLGCCSRKTGGPEKRYDLQIDKAISRFFAGHTVCLPNFTEKEVSKLARHSLVGTGVAFDQNTVALVYKYASGHPFTTQLLLHHLYESQIGGALCEDTFNSALHNLIRDISPFVKDLYRDPGDNESIVLELISKRKRGLSVRGIRHLLVKNNLSNIVPQVDTICTQLKSDGFLEENDAGKYQVKDLLFKECILGGLYGRSVDKTGFLDASSMRHSE